MAAALALLAVAALSGGLVSAASEPPTPATRQAAEHAAERPVGPGQYAADIRRTEFDIPHIRANTYGSLGFGLGYAFAQDDLCVLAQRVLTLRGERSRFFGGTARPVDDVLPAHTNLDSDTYYQSIRDAGTVDRLLAQPAPLGPTVAAREMVDGYAEGYNRYLHDTGVANLPDPSCRGTDWVTPITAADIWANILDLDKFEGTGNFKDAIAAAVPGAGATGPPPHGTSAVGSGAAPTGADTGIGSNGWALGRDATQDHDGMALINPHFLWNGGGRFYQVQLTIPGVLDVSGAGMYGTPAVWLGHTRGVAWMLTVSAARHFTQYRLALAPGDPTSYLLDGQVVPMTRQNVTVQVRGADGTLAPVTRTLYGSRFGPVLGTGWTATTASAIDDPNADNLRSEDQWLEMDAADTLDQLRAAQHTYQGLPVMATEATDAAGSAYFVESSVVPHVTDAQAASCAEPGPPGVLDGSRTACAWGSDPDAVEPGIFGPNAYPTLTRTDFVANSNESPWLVNPAAPLTGYPGEFGDIGTDRGLRPRLGQEMIAQRLAGTDGSGAAGFTLANLRQTMLNNRDYSAEIGKSDVVAMCAANPLLTASDGNPIDLRDACHTLAAWDGRADLDSQGAVLWREFFWRLFRNNGPNTWWTTRFDPAHPLTTPSGINGSLPGVRRSLADAVEFFGGNHIPVGLTPGSAQHYASVPLPGCLAPEGCFDVVTPPTVPLGRDGTYPDLTQDVTGSGHGSSFIMAVELTGHGPRASTLLTYSESANPDSPHRTDQTTLFAHGQWVTDRFTDAEIEADRNLQVTSLRG